MLPVIRPITVDYAYRAVAILADISGITHERIGTLSPKENLRQFRPVDLDLAEAVPSDQRLMGARAQVGAAVSRRAPSVAELGAAPGYVVFELRADGVVERRLLILREGLGVDLPGPGRRVLAAEPQPALVIGG